MTKLILAPLLLLAGCAGGGGDVSTAQSAVRAFRAQLAAGQGAAIYAAAAPSMREATRQGELMALLDAVHRDLGPFRWASYPRLKRQGAMVRLDYASAYQRGPAAEAFVFRVENGRAQLVGYDIRSELLDVPAPGDAE